MSDPYSVKGSSIRMRFEFVGSRFGPEAEATMRRRFRNHRELEALLDVNWIPFPLGDDVSQYIARVYFGGDLTRLREVGQFSAERGLQTIYKVWVRGKTFVEFLQQMPENYKTLYNAGDLTVAVGEDQTSVILSFRNAPQYSQAELHTMTGFFIGAAKVMGLPSVTHHAALVPRGMDITLRLWTDRTSAG